MVLVVLRQQALAATAVMVVLMGLLMEVVLAEAVILEQTVL